MLRGWVFNCSGCRRSPARSRSRYVSVPILPLPKDRGTDRVAGGGSSNNGSPGWPGAGGGGAESWGVHPAHPNPSPPSLAAEAGAELPSPRAAAGSPPPSAMCSGGEGKINNASGRSTFHSWSGFRISFLFSWVYEEVRGLARAHRADGLGEFIWILVGVWDTETWPWIIRLKEKAISPPQMAPLDRGNLLYSSLAGHGLQRLIFPNRVISWACLLRTN